MRPGARGMARSHHANDAYMAGFGSAAAAPPPARLLPQRSIPAPPPPPPPPDPLPRFSQRWRTGPRDPAGSLLSLSDRPIVAAALSGDGRTVALACLDHAAYVVGCAGTLPSRLVVGCAGAGTLPSRLATLHGARGGHAEWVTGVAFLPDDGAGGDGGGGGGCVATCAMDGQVLVWRRGGGGGAAATASRGGGGGGAGGSAPWRGSSCTALLGHFGSVSAVAAVGFNLLVSAGYDKTLRVWEVMVPRAAGAPPSRAAETPPACLAVLAGVHAAPVLLLAVPRGDELAALSRAAPSPPAPLTPVVFASGDRDGVACIWALDPVSGRVACCRLPAHAGHVTALAWALLPSTPAAAAAGAAASRDARTVLLTGGQDGHVRAWDAAACIAAACESGGRATGAGAPPPPPPGACLADVVVHAGEHGVGAVSDVAVARCGEETLVVTAGADRTLAVLDPAAGYAVRHRLSQHRDFVYSLAVAGPLVLSGGGDGTLLCHDVATGTPLWGLGANQAAVRCIVVAAGGDALVAAGDDGCVLLYDMRGAP